MTRYNMLSVNLRYKNPFDKFQWDDRKFLIKDIIEEYNPDFIGFQETTPSQFEDIKEFFNEKYEIYGEYRDDSEGKEMNPIFAKRENFYLKNKNSFWLSSTPSVKYSNTWDGDLPRICSFATVYSKSNSSPILNIMNTHFDHVGIEAREKSTKLILEKIEEINSTNNLPVIISGDFNTHPEDGYIDLLLKNNNFDNSFKKYKDKENSMTIHNYTGEIKGSPIDYIFVQKPLTITKSEIVRKIENQIFSSDHYHIYIEFE